MSAAGSLRHEASSEQRQAKRLRRAQRASSVTVDPVADDTTNRTSDAQNLLHLQRIVGNRAVGRLIASRKAVPAEGRPIQRLMTLAEFQTATPGSRRKKVLPIDQALQAYNQLPLNNFTNRNNRLIAIIHACDNYLSLPDKSAKRKPGVRRLRTQVGLEQRIVSRLSLAEGTNDEIIKFKWLAEAREEFIETDAVNNAALQYLLTPLNNLTNACINSVAGTPKEQQLIQKDLAELTRMRHDNTLPAILRNVLAEILANVGQVKFQEGLPGATLSKAGVAEKYTVKHLLNQPGGQTERLGSLAHELTHVATSEKFNNTPLFLAFRPGAADDVILALVAQRDRRLVEIETELDADHQLNAEQKSLVRNKLDYGKSNKLQQYATTYFAANKISSGQRDYINDLATKANNAVIEYDTVVNQMLVYMARWQVPLNNPLYAKIREVAQEAFDYRRNG